MKTKHIKKNLLFAAFAVLTWGMSYGQELGNGNLPAQAESTAICGTDTVAYPQSKATGTSTTALYKGDTEGIAQWYELPSIATLQGISFRAYVQDGAHVGKSATVTVKVYSAGPDSLPQGIALSLITVQVDTNLREWKAPLLTSIALTGNYLVSVEYGNGLTENDTLMLELNAPGDGAGESLGAGIYNTAQGDIWLDFEHLISNPDRDAMIFPWLSYSLTTGFSSPGDSVCVNEPLLFTNTTTAIANSRMYNRRIQDNGTFGNAFSWSFGDGTTMTDLDPMKTYTATGAYSVLLTSAITGYNTQCSEPIASAIVVVNRPTAMFVSSSNTVVTGDTILFTSTSSGGTCAWDFGDGSPVVNSCNDQYHAYDSSGTFVVTQTVTSPYGCQETYLDTIMVQVPLGTADASQVLSVQVWPNPVLQGSSIHIRWAQGESPMDCKLFDLNGRLLSHQTVGNTTSTKIELPDQAGGMLILQLEQNGRRSHKTVVVSR